jgi:PTS system cellobiose-specific IIA component
MTTERLNQISMQMLTLSGDAKKLLTEVLDDLANPDTLSGDHQVKLSQAHQYLVDAHKQQNLVTTEIDHVSYSVLFAHAQDTLMNTETIEFIIKKFIPILQNQN